MLAEKRQGIIGEHIKKYGAVTTSHLMEEFGISIETVRRDLLSMEQRGLLRRVHGGAVEIRTMRPFNPLQERNQECIREKRELSLTAAAFVCENDILCIDSGSTAIHFAEVLKERFSHLTVITHSLDVFQILCGYKDFQVILCGGHFNKNENAFYGSIALEILSKTYVQKAFLFPSAISLEFGICDFQEELFQIQKQMLRHADSVFLLADSDKFEKKALLKLDDMRTEYHYITDSNLPEELVHIYQENNISVYRGDKI